MKGIVRIGTAALFVAFLGVTGTFGQSADAVEAEVKEAAPYWQMEARFPGLTLEQYNEAVEALVDELVRDSEGDRRLEGRRLFGRRSDRLGVDERQVRRDRELVRPAPTVIVPLPGGERGAKRPGLELGVAPGGMAGSVSGSSSEIGDFTYHNLSDSEGRTFTGTTTEIGDFRYHSLTGSDGTAVQGSSTRIGDFTYHSFTRSDGTAINGTSTQVGDFTFHNFTASDGSSVTGTTTRLGDFTFHDFTSTGGGTASGTTTTLGDVTTFDLSVSGND